MTRSRFIYAPNCKNETVLMNAKNDRLASSGFLPRSENASARFRAVGLPYGGLKVSCRSVDNRTMVNLGQGRANSNDSSDRRAYENGRASGLSKEGELWLLAVVQNTSDVVTIVEADATVRYVSPSIECMLGYLPHERVGRSCFDLLHPDDLPRAKSTFAEALRRPGHTLVLGVRIRHRDGSWRQVEVTGTNLLDDETISGIVINWRDVTDHRRAEKALRESEQRFGSAFRDAAIGMALVGTDGRFMQVNRSLCRIVGYSEDELLEKTFQEITHPNHLKADTEQVRRMLSGEIETYQVEKRYLHKDGHVVWGLLNISLVYGEEGDPLYFIAQIQDITERKRAEETLRKSEGRYRALTQNSSDLVTLLATDSTFRYQSPSVERILGYRPEELLGTKAFDYINPEDLHRAWGEFLRGLEDPDLVPSVEYRFRHKDGHWVWLESVGSNLLDDPEVGEFVVNSRDVTERRRAEERLRESEERFRLLAENAQDFVFRYRLKPIPGFDYVSPSATAITGYTPEDFYGDPELGVKIIHPNDRHLIDEVLSSPEAPVTIRWWCKGGEMVWIEQHNRPILDEAGNLVAIEGIGRDVTKAKKAEEALRRSEASLAEAQRIAHLGRWEWDLKTGEVWWSDEAYRIYGFEPQEFSPTLQTIAEVFHPDDRHRFRAIIEDAAHEAEPYDFEHRIVRPDGEVRWVHRRGEVVRGEDEESLRMRGIVHDITERKALGERLHYQAFHDPLTDLPNRALFVDRLGQALRHTRRRLGHKVAVLFMDLDNFKVVNDSLGHEAGNRLLVAVSERLEGCLRPEDTLARFGGDEFTVLIEDVEKPEDAVGLAERAIEALRVPFALQGRELFIKPSIGIALGEARTKSPEDLMRDADTAMYRAKEEGAGYRVFEPVMHEQTLRWLKLENDMRRAIEAEEFVVRYQPIVDLRTSEAWGVEALVRWQHPERGLLDPKEFVPSAEESGLVVPMGRRVLEEACHWAREWQERCPRTPPLTMSVNLSAKQLHRPDLDKIVEETLEETKLEASCLCLDITETVCIGALKDHGAALDKLKRLGVCISIDDFGTGYSSLAYLKRLPADTLKIDKAFVAGLGESVEDTAIVRMVIELAHTLGMEVVAEGVESEKQAQQLREMGCDKGQGYHFAEPLSPEEASRFLLR